VYIIDKKKCVAMLFCVSAIGYVMGSPLLDRDLDPFSAVALAEKEVRLLEQDLNGNGKFIPEEDMLLLSNMVRKQLNMVPYNDLLTNIPFLRVEVGKVMTQFVAKRAQQHASVVAQNSRIVHNAAAVESNEFMNLLQKNPLRKGENLRHYFGEIFERRVKDNVMYGRKYNY
jgi:hypothetical protein